MADNFQSTAGSLGNIDLPLHAECRAFVASHETVSGDYGPGRYGLHPDIISCETNATTQGSTANLMLLPRRPYTHWIFPGDWISIYMSSGANAREGFGVVGMRESKEDNTRVFFGIVDAVRENVTTQANGKTQVRISLSCNGAQGMIDRTEVYYNQQLGPGSLFGSMLPGLATLTMGIPLSGTPATIPRSIALAYLGFGGQLLMPTSYPMAKDTEENRRAQFNETLNRSLQIEQALGILNTRGANGKFNPTLVQRAIKSANEQYTTRSLGAVLDLFTYVEDMFVSGRVVNTPTHEQQSSVWKLMMENVNPILNECFISLLPPRDPNGKRNWKGGDEDEWGMRPHLKPSLVIRERPFAWRSEKYKAPGGLDGRRPTDIYFGDVFFSQRGQSNKFPQQQSLGGGVSTDVAKKKLLSLDEIQRQIKTIQGGDIFSLAESVRAVDRIKIRASDINAHTLGLSNNDHFNFYMISMASSPLSQAHQKYTLLMDGLIPIFLPESIKRYGLKLRDMSTKFMYLGGPDIDSKQALDFLVRSLMAYDVWYQHSPWYRAGTMGVRPIPAAQPGMVLDVQWPNAEESFYVEQVNQSFEHGENGQGMLRTNLTLTRGQPSGFSDPSMRFNYAPPDSVQVFPVNPDTGAASREEKQRPVAAQQPTVVRSPLVTDEDKVIAWSKVILDLETEGVLLQGMYQTYFNNLLKTPENKRVLATAKRAIQSEEGNGISAGEIQKIQERYDKIAAKRKLPPIYLVRQDRLDAGRPPWALGQWRFKMFSAARIFLARVHENLSSLFRTK